MKVRYFDHAATTKIKSEVLDAMIPYLKSEYGNPSSLYSVGRDAKFAVEESRKKVANAINAQPYEIYFTSCGSESDNLALKGITNANKNKEKNNIIITSKIEHPAILNSCKTLEREGIIVEYIDVDKNGFIDLIQLENTILKYKGNEKENNILMISIMYANNEIGTIQKVEEISKIAHKYNIIFHTDAVQAVGNIRIDVKKMQIDILSLSAHKFYGPKGIGALYVKEGINFNRIQDGGNQERLKRSGTENVAEIVGIGKAIEIANVELINYNKNMKYLRDYCEKEINKNITEIRINGDKILRLPGNLNVSFKGIDNSELLLNLDRFGICASGGSACSSGSNKPSHVLTAIGLTQEYIKGSVRFTFGEENTKEDVDYLLDILIQLVARLRK